jgi:hypothetical protein
VNTHKLAGAVAAVALTIGVGAATAAPAHATDNIKTFGEEERLNGPNSAPYIGYTVNNFGPSNDPVPHNGKLYSATLVVDGYGTGTNPMIERFGARAQNGMYYPSIAGASNLGMLYFDVVGVEPNSVVWNDGVRDILAWVHGDTPLEPTKAPPAPPPPPAYLPPYPPVSEPDPFAVGAAGAPAGAMPAESDPAIVATPNDLAPPPFQLSEADVAQPGFNR